MFKQYIVEILAARYEDKILIFDLDNIESRYNYSSLLIDLGFEIINYSNATNFRYIFETRIKNREGKFAVIVTTDQYIPYDIIKVFYNVKISWEILFPNLNKDVLINDKQMDLPLLYTAYTKLFDNLQSYEESSLYLAKNVYGEMNIRTYIRDLKNQLLKLVLTHNIDYKGWIDVAREKSKAEYLAAKAGISIDMSPIDNRFKDFILDGYQYISGVVSSQSPIIVSRVMDFISKSNQKVAIIILDGMSLFDFNIICSHFDNIEYDEGFIYAMVPTTTAISRQSLLSGKFPIELDRPFDLSREEREFREKARSLGYLKNQISYSRGYNIDIGPNVKIVSIILNDLDNLIHNQLQGRIGMYNDVDYFARSGKLQDLIKNLHGMGFSIYLTSDHGNTLCKGIGRITGIGVEVETRSKRMLVLKDFANSRAIVERHNLISYPGYYLNKDYQYLICDTGRSFDSEDLAVMTHGGISIDEVIVPFIKIKVVYYD